MKSQKIPPPPPGKHPVYALGDQKCLGGNESLKEMLGNELNMFGLRSSLTVPINTGIYRFKQKNYIKFSFLNKKTFKDLLLARFYLEDTNKHA